MKSEGLQYTSTERMRMENARSILRLVHEEKLLYRKNLATKTKLASQTVTNIVTLLVDNHVLKEFSMETLGRGRNPLSLQINYSDFYMISIEITSRLIHLYVNDLEGKIYLSNHISFPEEENVLGALKEYLHYIKRENSYKIAAIICSVEGIVDSENAVVMESNDLRWFNVDLKKEFSFFNVPVYAINDMGLMAYFEKIESEKHENYMILRVDDGVGSSFVINQAVIGNSKMGGEVGHYTIPVLQEEKRCFCGKTNCLTQFISKTALENTMKKSYSEIIEAVKSGENEAMTVIEKVSDYLMPVLTNLITVLDLNKIVLTGCIVEDFGSLFVKKLEQMIKGNLSRWNRFSNIECKKYHDFALICSRYLLELYFENSATIPLLWDTIFMGAKCEQEGQP